MKPIPILIAVLCALLLSGCFAGSTGDTPNQLPVVQVVEGILIVAGVLLGLFLLLLMFSLIGYFSSALYCLFGLGIVIVSVFSTFTDLYDAVGWLGIVLIMLGTFGIIYWLLLALNKNSSVKNGSADPINPITCGVIVVIVSMALGLANYGFGLPGAAFFAFCTLAIILWMIWELHKHP